MNTYHIFNAINSCLVKNLTNEVYKYISESIIRILFRDIKTMLLDRLSEKFAGISQDLGSKVRVGAIALPLAFGGMAANDATAQNLVAAAPNGQTVAVAPAARDIQPSKGSFTTVDVRKRSGQFLEDAPFRASNDRISVILYGEDNRIMNAVGYAGKIFAKNVHDVSYLWAKDDNADPGNVTVGIYANGRFWGHFDIGVDADQKDVAKEVYLGMQEAYATFIEPRLMASNTAPPPAASQ